MAGSLKDKGWDLMRSVLDREMPVRNKRPRFLLPLIFGLFLTGLVIGWHGRALWSVRPSASGTGIHHNLRYSDHPAEARKAKGEQLITLEREAVDRRGDQPGSHAPHPVAIRKHSNRTAFPDHNRSADSVENNLPPPPAPTPSVPEEAGPLNSDAEGSAIALKPALPSDRITTLDYDAVYSPLLIRQDKKEHLPRPNPSSRPAREFIIDFGLLHKNKPSYGIQTNVLFFGAKRFSMIAGAGYRYLSLERDYSFRNNGIIVFEPEIQPITRATVFYIEDIHQVHLNVGLDYRLNKFISLRGAMVPALNMVSGTFLENHPLLSEKENNSYFSFDYNAAVQIRVLPKFSLQLNYHSNLLPFADVAPDQGAGHNFYRRYALGLSYRLY